MTIFTALDLQRVSLLSQLFDYDEWLDGRPPFEIDFDLNNMANHYLIYIQDAF
jgi:hypothetical protein